MCSFNITVDESKLAHNYLGVASERFVQWLQKWVCKHPLFVTLPENPTVEKCTTIILQYKKNKIVATIQPF